MSQIPAGIGFQYHVEFQDELKEEPFININITHVAMLTYVDKSAFFRIKAEAENISKTGFDVRVRSWSKTVLYGFTLKWIAFSGQKID